ncbi:MAG TPA: hypothetical protein VIL16_13620, partial [Trebonia sp.]
MATLRVTPKPTSSSGAAESTTPRPPGVSGDRLEAAVREASKTASAMAKDKHVLAWALVWASLNWLLDAASLW